MRPANRLRYAAPVLFIGLAFPQIAGSSDGQTGTTGAVFLETEQGARGIGMGGAFSAAVDDGSALWWNPAGLARQAATEFDFNHTALIEGISTEYLGFTKAVPQLSGGIGASLTYLAVPGIDSFDASKNSLGTINASGYAGTLGYGLAASSAMTFGASLKLIGQTLAGTSGTGVAGDLGAQYRINQFGLGLAIQNLGPSFHLGGVSSPLPRTIRGGGYYTVHQNVMIALEEESPSDASPRIHLGGEWRPAPLFSLRAGFQQTPDVGAGAGFTVGFGLMGVFGGRSSGSWSGDLTNFWRLPRQDIDTALKEGAYMVGLDYAFVSNGTLNDINRIGVFVRF